MTLNEIEGLIELQVRFRCSKPDVGMLLLSELTMSG